MDYLFSGSWLNCLVGLGALALFCGFAGGNVHAQPNVPTVTYPVDVLRIDGGTTVSVTAKLEVRAAYDEVTTRARLKLPVGPASDTVVIDRTHFPENTRELFGSFDSYELEVWKFPTIPEEGREATFHLMGNPVLDDPTRVHGYNSYNSGDYRRREFALVDLAGKAMEKAKVTAFDKLEKTTHTLRLLEGGRLVIPEFVLYGNRVGDPMPGFFDIMVYDPASGTGCDLNSPLCRQVSKWGSYSETRTLPFLNDWSQVPENVNLYQGVFKGERETPQPNQQLLVTADVTDTHIMPGPRTLKLVTNNAGEFRFGLQNKTSEWYEKNVLCAIRLPFGVPGGRYYVIKAGTGIVVDSTKPEPPGMGQRMEQPK